MGKERLVNSNIEGQESKKKGRVKKMVLTSLLAALIAVGGVSYGFKQDIKKARERKNADKEKYGIVDINPDKTVSIIKLPNLDGGPDTLNVHLDSILGHNRDTVNIDATRLVSIIIGEESLKTNNEGIVKKLVESLEKKGVDRSPYSQSFTGKSLSKIKEGSYGPFQVQAQAIDKYKEKPELYDDLCKKIAVFKLPNINGEYVPLHEQLGLTVNEMVRKIKNHEIYTFAGGERFLIAYGIVLIDQISREVESKVDSYDGTEGYNRWIDNTSKVEQDYKELRGNDNDIMAPYILTNKGNVSYDKIGELFNNDAFINGMVSAYWCMDYLKNTENSNYLYLLSLLELNEWFKNSTGDLDIVMPTGRFGPSTVKLVNKHFDKNFDPDKDLKEAKTFMDGLSPKTLQSLKDSAVNSFEKNMRLLYTLNSGDNHGINQTQAKYLSECLDITFNHMYAGVTIFSEFVNNNCLNKSDSLKQLRSNYVQKHDKASLEELKKIMTDEDTFVSFTGLSKSSYLKWIKYHLCPTLLGATDWVYQTGGIIPVIQDNPGGTRKSNEQNSVFRFIIGDDLSKKQQQEYSEKGYPRKLEGVYDSAQYNVNLGRHIIADLFYKHESLREYLKKCCDINGKRFVTNDSIDMDSIPDELVYEMLRGEDGENHVFQNGTWFYEGDTIRVKCEGLEKVYRRVDVKGPATTKEILEKKQNTKKTTKKGTRKPTLITVKKNVNLCTVNVDGTLTMEKGGTFQEILYIYSQKHTTIKNILETIAGKPIEKQEDIKWEIIKKVIKQTNGKDWEHINKVNKGDKFIIVVPLN